MYGTQDDTWNQYVVVTAAKRLSFNRESPVPGDLFSLFRERYPNKQHSLESVRGAPLTVLSKRCKYISRQAVFLETITTTIAVGDMVVSLQQHTDSFKGDVLIIMNYTAWKRANTVATKREGSPPGYFRVGFNLVSLVSTTFCSRWESTNVYYII